LAISVCFSVIEPPEPLANPSSTKAPYMKKYKLTRMIIIAAARISIPL
jgi:hypothetical protein